MKRSNKKNIEDEKTSGSEESEPEPESESESENSEVIEDVADLDFDDNDEEGDEEDDDDNIDETELKKENEIDNEDIIDCFYDFEQNEINNIQNIQNNDVPKEDRITMPYLTKYERVRVLGTRAKQISLGAKILVKNVDLTTKNPIEIAKIELELGIVPFKIRRPLPNGKVEEWKISELVKPK
jgi:DNA-directed RNA polymerase I, II, and III subunit RPABC2